ncbi:MAG: hypothetical protein OEZ02_03265, partial [Anaerolineae bacterium]|nr:hypothetical protein [Anaerolineae bacterium]
MQKTPHKLIVVFALMLWAGAAIAPIPASAQEVPAQAYVSGLVGHAQAYGLSCESRSAADVAAFWGVPVSETQFLNKLPRSDNPEVG